MTFEDSKAPFYLKYGGSFHITRLEASDSEPVEPGPRASRLQTGLPGQGQHTASRKNRKWWKAQVPTWQQEVHQAGGFRVSGLSFSLKRPSTCEGAQDCPEASFVSCVPRVSRPCTSWVCIFNLPSVPAARSEATAPIDTASSACFRLCSQVSHQLGECGMLFEVLIWVATRQSNLAKRTLPCHRGSQQGYPPP
ncbi:hypothetical protein MGG_16661 [Pyricularia oryzae 70-15]|uniref:Uncharacterized protein n=3 Tax=Pyricularia oryzae TaxID=318829 RepID=G4N2I3_PYRO7|nr:uncharacterized protein MGG_16661 [Pyricularia oryzae 70-15]EHA51692.1 hypothetical protein MGG_16661 [Pyricularia oryzae 70-15]ELQ40302.1 hypothetical protein OOU_Y34scaffold00449g4 [Pyricularia oryzae Y34]